MRVKRLVNVWVAMVGFVGLFSSCSNDAGYAPAPRSAPFYEESDRAVPAKALASEKVKATGVKPRMGIATGFGDEVESAIGYTDFTRTSSKPKYVTMIRYNDDEGAKAMGVNRGTKGSGMQQGAGGLIEWGMSRGWGSLDNYWWRGGRFVIGKKGRSYQLKVKNLSISRVEVVLSVDGLDVMDGKPASTKKRGYIIAPGKTLVVKGFRTSESSVASFKFSSVSSSYANLKHGNTRNVGVIGLALFTEKGREPWVESTQRGRARAFAEAPLVRARD